MKKTKIKEMREKKGISCDKFARLAKISRSQMYNIENGTTKNVLLKNIKKLAKAFNVQIAEIIEWLGRTSKY
jgi:DNA-binding XRE family transcriptional regulator